MQTFQSWKESAIDDFIRWRPSHHVLRFREWWNLELAVISPLRSSSRGKQHWKWFPTPHQAKLIQIPYWVSNNITSSLRQIRL